MDNLLFFFSYSALLFTILDAIFFTASNFDCISFLISSMLHIFEANSFRCLLEYYVLCIYSNYS